MFPFFRHKVEGIGLEDGSKIGTDILQPYKAGNLEAGPKIKTDWVNSRTGNKQRDGKRQRMQRYIKRHCKRLFRGRSSKWALIATWLIDLVETDMRAGDFHAYDHYTTTLRNFTYEKFKIINATPNAIHSSDELDQVAAAWFKHHHEFDEETRKIPYSVDSNNVPPRVSAWVSQFFKRYGT